MYVGQLLRWYGGGAATYDWILHELPMVQGYALRAVAMETDGWMQFAGVKRSSEGFIVQEVKSRLK